MKFSLLIVTVLVASAFSSSVKILTDDNFDEIIGNNENVIVEFFAPWCGHCKSLAPHYEKAAAKLADDNIILASVDATVYGSLAGKFDVKGYPTLKVFKSGVASEYKGGRTEETIVSYARKTFGPPATEIDTAEQLTKAKDNKVAVVGFFESKNADLSALLAYAKTDEDVQFFFTTNVDLATQEGVSVPGLKLFKSFDERENTFSGSFTKDSIAEFVGANSVPTVIPFSMEAVQEIFSSKMGKVCFFFRDSSDADSLDKEFLAAASSFRGLAVFVTSDYSETRLNQYIGVDPSMGARFILAETPQGGNVRRFPLEGTLTGDNMKAHLEAYKANLLTPAMKSDPVPASNNGPVKVVVGRNFNDIVMDESKDVLLEVYAPWCGHCKKLEPIWNELGEEYQDDSSIVIAKMDGTSNEVDGLAAQGFPTIVFYPAGSKSVSGVAYQGGRDLEAFKSFIAENKKATGSVKFSSHEDL